MRSALGLRAARAPRPGRGLLVAAAVAAAACSSAPDPARYRLAHSGSHWDVVGSDRVFEDLEPRYPEFFSVVLNPSDTRDLDLLALREDLERSPVSRRNFDALNAVAIAYFELNYRAQRYRGSVRFLGDSFRASKLLAVPWRAYGETEDPTLRDAILDFFEDAASGEKAETAGTAGRLARVVASLERKETDAARAARIRALTEHIELTYGAAAPR